jgi:hypothetical protein
MTKRMLLIISIAVPILGGAFFIFQTAATAHDTNGVNGFPLDDPWIHLQFARNLHEYGTFSYYKDQEVTSGSTSPLYTLLLAFGMIFSNDEYVLSYALGGAFLLGSVLAMFRLAERLFGHRLVISIAAASLVALEPRLLWASLSGMETTMFIALVLAVTVFYVEKRPVLLGLGSGLLLWARPEALLMIGVLAADALYHWKVAQKAGSPGTSSRRAGPTWLLGSLLIAVVFGTAYVAFNLLLSGSVFPNTFAAKLKYYGSGGQGFPSQLVWFLSAQHMIAIAPFAAVGVLATVLALVRRRPAPMLLPLLWSCGMIAAYWWKLPYLYQYGRYLMPILPFVILLGLSGLDGLMEIGRARIPFLKSENNRTVVGSAVALIMVVSTAAVAWQRQIYYSESCRYIADRQVATANWIRGHLPEDAIVATHDVGAIAYYSGRRIVDMVGLISPEMIDRIGRIDMLLEYLARQKVTHLAVLRSWFEVTNVHPLFMTNELSPEVMEVFRFDPEHMHFMNQTASMLSERARLELAAGNVQQAGAMLEQANRYDANSSRVHLLLGRALMLVGKLEDADREFGLALALQPDLWDARFGQADVAARAQKPGEAIAKLEALIQDNPEYIAGYQALTQLYYRTRKDTAKAAYYLRRFKELTAGTPSQPPR